MSKIERKRVNITMLHYALTAKWIINWIRPRQEHYIYIASDIWMAKFVAKLWTDYDNEIVWMVQIYLYITPTHTYTSLVLFSRFVSGHSLLAQEIDARPTVSSMDGPAFLSAEAHMCRQFACHKLVLLTCAQCAARRSSHSFWPTSQLR